MSNLKKRRKISGYYCDVCGTFNSSIHYDKANENRIFLLVQNHEGHKTFWSFINSFWWKT